MNTNKFYGNGDYEKFKKLAQNRTQQVLISIKKIANLSNGRHYSYTKSDVDKIVNAINSELKSTQNAFKNQMSKSDKNNLFKL